MANASFFPMPFGHHRSLGRHGLMEGWFASSHSDRGAEAPDRPGADGPRSGGGQRFTPPWAGGPFGTEARSKVRRGDTREAVLLLLLEGPKHGYQLITEIAERSSGNWTPSPGSVYPVMSALGDDGLITVAISGRRRTFSLTAQGRRVAEHRRRDGGPAPWEQFDDDPHRDRLRESAKRLLLTLRQLADDGNPAAVAAVTERLDTLRRDIYRTLAEEPSASHDANSTDTTASDEPPSSVDRSASLAADLGAPDSERFDR